MEYRLNVSKPTGRQIHPSLRPRHGTKAIAAKVGDPRCQEKLRARGCEATVPQTDTGRWGENPKAHVRMLVQELGKLAP
jgi:hypothetical protein